MRCPVSKATSTVRPSFYPLLIFTHSPKNRPRAPRSPRRTRYNSCVPFLSSPFSPYYPPPLSFLLSFTLRDLFRLANRLPVSLHSQPPSSTQLLPHSSLPPSPPIL